MAGLKVKADSLLLHSALAQVERRPITPYRPQTFGLAERFNGRITEILKSPRFHSATELSTAPGHPCPPTGSG